MTITVWKITPRVWIRVDLAIVLINAVGVALYIWFCSALWVHATIEPESGDVDMAAASYWAETAVPVFLFCAVVDLVWLAVVFMRSRPPVLWRGCLLWVLVVAGWVGCWWYTRTRFDRANYGIYSPVSAPGLTMRSSEQRLATRSFLHSSSCVASLCR